ncbi:hypothetical protein Pelo_19460 [Pelomyxa schiedti]|nr:hypothetical protein Pelo_19460 [Pelomyxa schiedti]
MDKQTFLGLSEPFPDVVHCRKCALQYPKSASMHHIVSAFPAPCGTAVWNFQLRCSVCWIERKNHGIPPTKVAMDITLE